MKYSSLKEVSLVTLVFFSKAFNEGKAFPILSFSRNFVDSCPQAILYPAMGILAQLVVLVVVIYYCEVRRQKDIFLHRGTIAHMFQQIQELRQQTFAKFHSARKRLILIM